MDRQGSFCFRTKADVSADLKPATCGLSPAAAEALATLLPLLICGEESASLVFEGLADAQTPHEAQALHLIAAEERQHEALLHGLAQALPQPARQADMRQAARRFYLRQQHRSSAIHFARIAALDSGACVVLASLLRPQARLAAAQAVAQIFRRIHADETRHVRLSRQHCVDRLPLPALREVMQLCREQLADVLQVAGDSLDLLGVDASTLDRTLRQVPRGLLA